MRYGYARVSTKKQAKDGNSLEAQTELLLANGAQQIVSDTFTGRRLDRPQLQALLARLEPGDVLLATKLDRVARSISQGSQLVSELMARGVTVHILNLGILDNSPASRLIRNVFFAFAEFERDLIVERTTEGKAIARLAPGYQEGRPRTYTDEDICYCLTLMQELSINTTAKVTGISRRTLQRWYATHQSLLPVIFP